MPGETENGITVKVNGPRLGETLQKDGVWLATLPHEAGRAPAHHRLCLPVPEDLLQALRAARAGNRVFDGSAKPLLVHLAENRQLTREELDELARLMDEQQKGGE